MARRGVEAAQPRDPVQCFELPEVHGRNYSRAPGSAQALAPRACKNDHLSGASTRWGRVKLSATRCDAANRDTGAGHGPAPCLTRSARPSPAFSQPMEAAKLCEPTRQWCLREGYRSLPTPTGRYRRGQGAPSQSVEAKRSAFWQLVVAMITLHRTFPRSTRASALPPGAPVRFRSPTSMGKWLARASCERRQALWIAAVPGSWTRCGPACTSPTAPLIRSSARSGAPTRPSATAWTWTGGRSSGATSPGRTGARGCRPPSTPRR